VLKSSTCAICPGSPAEEPVPYQERPFRYAAPWLCGPLCIVYNILARIGPGCHVKAPAVLGRMKASFGTYAAETIACTVRLNLETDRFVATLGRRRRRPGTALPSERTAAQILVFVHRVSDDNDGLGPVHVQAEKCGLCCTGGCMRTANSRLRGRIRQRRLCQGTLRGFSTCKAH
jgi:hypothetical protein